MAGTVDIQRLVLSQWPDAGLSKTERAMLGYLAHAGQPVSEAELLTQVWGYAPGVRSQTVQATVRRVRTKIEADPKRPVHLLTVRGHGYRLIVSAGETSAESTSEDAANRLKRWFSAAGDEVTVVVRRDARTNIGSPLDETIGREASFDLLIDLFAQHARVVTLHGAGGVGKTRLGRAVGRHFAEDHIGGSWFCDVSEVSSGTEVVECVADALGIVRQVRRSVMDQIADTVASKGPTFVVVDNAEQLEPDGVDALFDLLRRCAAVRLLITSRRVLGLPGERVVPLGRLSPDDAAALLRQRVDVVRADRTDPIDEEAVKKLAERLDGIPLAIELAAARARVIPLRELAARVAHNLDVLDGARSLGPERHRTLRQTFLWSWKLLSETQQLALVRLAVFRGGFTLDAASAVLDGLGEPLSLVAALADAALVHRHNDVPGRMALFDTLRVFALECGKNHAQDARERHAGWLLGTLSTEGLGAVRDADFRALHSEADNAAAAVGWLTQTRNPAVFRLLHRFYSVVYVTGQRIDVFQSWISSVRAAFDLDPDHAALLLFLESQLAIVEGSYARAAERSALALQKSPANAPVAAAILCTRALATTKLGRVEDGLEIANQAVAHPHRCGGRAFSVLGNALLANGRRDDALNAFRAAEQEYAGEGSSIGVASCLRNVAGDLFDHITRDEALDAMKRGAALLEQVGATRMGHAAQEFRVSICMLVGDHVAAAGHARILLDDMARTHVDLGNFGILANCGMALVLGGDVVRGRACMSRSRALLEKNGVRVGSEAWTVVVSFDGLARTLDGDVVGGNEAWETLKAHGAVPGADDAMERLQVALAEAG